MNDRCSCKEEVVVKFTRQTLDGQSTSIELCQACADLYKETFYEGCRKKRAKVEEQDAQGEFSPIDPWMGRG